MCGIAGIINFNGQPVARADLQQMNDLQRHRGPDGEGIYLDGAIGLGHRRLAIIDPEGGQQPFIDDERGTVLTYNGEVYNYREIRSELSGVSFRTESDTEVVLRAYQRWGINCLEKFRGMFGLAIYDSAKGMLYLVRDRLGIKPIYYALDGERLVFASEMTPVASVPGVGHTIDSDGIVGYLHLQYVPTPATIYKEIRKLAPGTYLKIDIVSGKSSLHTYWALDPQPGEENDQAALEQSLCGHLEDISRIYVRSDVPFGAFLSGGIDSSVVVACMTDVLDNPVESFTIGYAEEEHSETHHAARAAKTLSTNHHENLLSPEMALSIMRQIPRHFGEPFGDSSSVPTFFVSATAAENVKMVLSGDGGDELFAGYNSYPALFEQFGFASSPLHRFSRMQKQRLRGWFGLPAAETMAEAQNRWRRIFPYELVEELLGGSGGVGPAPPAISSPNDPFIRLQYQDVKTYLLDDILTKVDRMSMANSLEVRIPLLDHKLVEFAFSLPLESRLRHSPEQGVVTKSILKKFAGRYFPDDFVHRRKMGFGIPVMEWLHGPFKAFVRDIFNDRNSPMYQWLDRKVVAKVVDDFYAGHTFSPSHIWVLLMLKLWFDDIHKPAVL